jgi:hypothetical protein
MKLLSSFVKLEEDAKEITEVNEGLVKDVKRMFAGKTAKDRARQEIEKAATASIVNKDEKSASKHFKRYDKFDTLANGGVKMRKIVALSDNDLIKYSTDINKGVAGWDTEYTSLRAALKAEMKKRKLNEDTSLHAWGPLDEGVADKIKSFAKGILSPKKKEAKMLPLTKEQRDMIRKNFKSSNVDIKWSKDGEYVITQNAKANHGLASIYFRNEDGVLKASVSHFRNKSEVSDPKVAPIEHTDEKAETQADIDKLKAMLGEAVSSNAAHEIEWLKKKIAELDKKIDIKPSVAKEIKQLRHQIKERELAIAFNENKVEDIITDPKDRQTYLGLKIQEAECMDKYESTKDLAGISHMNMAKKHNADAENILYKYKKLKEAITYTDIEDWKQAVKNSYPQQAKRITFMSKMQGKKMTVSAEIKGEDRCYGVWDQEDDKGVVLSEDNFYEAGLKGAVSTLMNKASFKANELDQELGHEDTKSDMKFGIEIDGKLWKKDGKAVEFPSKVKAASVALSGTLKFKKTTVVPLN